MSYATSNPPIKIAEGLAGGGALWFYQSADDDATVIAAAYVTDAQNLGMTVGDAVLIWDTATPKGSLAFVSAVASTGSTMTFAAVS